MAATVKNVVSAEDQEEINEFARVHKRLTESKAEVRMLTTELENHEEASNEIMLVEGDEPIPYQIGESFVYFTQDEADERIGSAKEKIQKALDGVQLRIVETQKKFDTLKASLYAKFGDNIGLETDE